MRLAQSLEEIIASRNVQDAIKFTAAMTQEQRFTISEDFQEQYGTSVGDHIRKLMSPSSSTSLLINMWLPVKYSVYAYWNGTLRSLYLWSWRTVQSLVLRRNLQRFVIFTILRRNLLYMLGFANSASGRSHGSILFSNG